jgi:hypothetical protein
MKAVVWVAVGLVLLLGPLQLEAAVGPDSPETLPVQFPTPEWFPTIAVQETAREIRIELPGDVLFDFDKSDIRPDAEPTLRQVAEIIHQYPRAKVAIAGYTDTKGADAYNLQLSPRRAESVKAWLVQQGGVDGKRMTTKRVAGTIVRFYTLRAQALVRDRCRESRMVENFGCLYLIEIAQVGCILD